MWHENIFYGESFLALEKFIVGALNVQMNRSVERAVGDLHVNRFPKLLERKQQVVHLSMNY